ncbi:hypothetical protein LTR20_001119 [Exophiala xenobiotica]|nr:hypothetical protein LTS13_005396 [Exophiala xenobiotica]KAK5396978.1 hypothetical protein LTR79_005614 [Exophiala xenobiotica]KAK5410613.1 hypothetical protein LTR90_008196 [Exophiala xenobiotica]KAK5470858.1 hypothetical protein LTR20_001119 [Exophiala xenobiotica]KAK5478462.1 hypothetical protein LTR26_007972 [Exophiala xenobiotica]
MPYPSHMVLTTLQAAILSAVSNLLAQFLKAHRENRPLTISVRPLLHFVMFTIISCPPNILWQDFLEDRFPAYTYSATSSDKVLSRRNTAHKLLFDQTLCAFVNTVAFVAAMAAFKGKNMKSVRRDVERDTIPLMINGWKLWPMVAFLNFVFVPVNHRIIVASIVGLFWGIYLSLFATLD